MTLAAFLSDSINLVPDGLPAQWYGTICAARLGWTTTMRGLSGSGYITLGTEGKCFADVVQADIIAHAPDVVVIEGGYNDFDQGHTIASTQTAMASLFATLKAGLPNAKVYVCGLYTPHTPLTTEVAFNAGMVATIGAAGFVLLPISGWMTGTGQAGDLKGDGNADIYIRGTSPDPHPTRAGAAYLGTRLAFAIRPPATGLDY